MLQLREQDPLRDVKERLTGLRGYQRFPRVCRFWCCSRKTETSAFGLDVPEAWQTVSHLSGEGSSMCRNKVLSKVELLHCCGGFVWVNEKHKELPDRSFHYKQSCLKVLKLQKGTEKMLEIHLSTVENDLIFCETLVVQKLLRSKLKFSDVGCLRSFSSVTLKLSFSFVRLHFIT